ncbi:hypothetical protein RCO48_37380 [Peribacillus frigoritolerans]|nr:hypothetical protein [Peribacillus frigoritolerans]
MVNGSPDPCSDADDHSAVFMANDYCSNWGKCKLICSGKKALVTV